MLYHTVKIIIYILYNIIYNISYIIYIKKVSLSPPSHGGVVVCLPQAQVLFDLLVFLLLDVAVAWDCYVYQPCLLLLFVNQHNVWLVSHHQLVSLYLEAPQDLGLVILNHLRRCLPYSVQMFLYTMPATWLWRSMYAVPACIIHPAIMR